MQIDPTLETNSPLTQDPRVKQQLGKDEFLKLLLAQISAQDPLNPMDDKEFIAQLAQFSSLEQAMQTNERLALLQVMESASANAQVTGLIGKSIVAQGDGLNIAGGVAPDIRMDLSSAAQQVTVRIIDETGKVVRTLELGNRPAGDLTVAWDGRNDLGIALADGNYRVQVEAVDSQGNDVGIDTLLSGVVTGVVFEDGIGKLLLGDVKINPADVVEVRDNSTASTPAGGTPSP